MNRPLRAGERLLPSDGPAPDPRGGGGGPIVPTRRPGGGGGRGPVVRRPHFALLRRLAGALLGLTVLAGAVGALVAWRAWVDL